jgi:hypothetical protein
LVGLHWKDPNLEVIGDPRLGENFRLLVPRVGYEAAYFNSRDQQVSRIQGTPDGVVCTYDSLHNDQETIPVHVRYRIRVASKQVLFSVEVDNPTDRKLAFERRLVLLTACKRTLERAGVAQKFICEQLVADYTRKGFLDGRSARLMTVRSGQPNGAASGFLSTIVREPLNRRPAVCPVPPETAVALSSPHNTIAGLIAVAEVETLGGRTAVNLPALTVRVSEMLDALEAVAGKAARERVRFELDPAIARIVEGWPSVFDNTRALRLGLKPDADVISIIRRFVNDQAVPLVGA